MSKTPLYFALIGGGTFTVANIILLVGSTDPTLRTVGALFTIGSVCFLISTLLQLFEK